MMQPDLSTLYEYDYRVLVVDDDDIARRTIRRSLHQTALTLDCHEASTVAEAYALLRDQRFDCVFLNYRLLDRADSELVPYIEDADVQAALIILTEQDDEKIPVDLSEARVSAYHYKTGMTPESLEQSIRNAIRIHRAELQAEIAHQQLRDRNELLQWQSQELERKHQQIQRQNLQLMEVSRIKAQFLATMSHEFRTPMNTIIGFSQLLLRSKQGVLLPQQQDMVQRIVTNGKHLLAILNDMLDLSQLEAGRLELQPRLVNLADIIHATAAELRSLAAAKQLPIYVQDTLDSPLITHDPDRLRQILTNLLSNAIKFTEEGYIVISASNPTPQSVEIIVRDTGIGIAPEQLPTIFEPFCQGDQSITRNHQGTGLGLALVYSLVQMMAGEIRIHSQLNQGTEVRITLPQHVCQGAFLDMPMTFQEMFLQ
jgi:signal transduction histidine kinase